MASAKFVCVGAGIIGSSWATAFARSGACVTLYDAVPDNCRKAMSMISAHLEELQRAGVLTSAAEAFSRISVAATLGEALEGASYVQESVFEDLDVKRQAYVDFDREAAPGTVFGSSVSGLPASRFMGDLRISPRCLVVHPTSPPHLVPLTEIFATQWTSKDTIERCEKIMARVGQVTVRVLKQTDGYVLNRIQAAVVNEALHLVGTGVMSATDLDKVLVHGLGLRWSITGPFLTGHLNAPQGYRDYMTRYGHHYRRWGEDLAPRYDWSMETIEEIHEQLSADPRFADATAGRTWRDRKLMALRRAEEPGEHRVPEAVGTVPADLS